MGPNASSFKTNRNPKNKATVLIVGVKAAGKTTVLSELKVDQRERIELEDEKIRRTTYTIPRVNSHENLFPQDMSLGGHIPTADNWDCRETNLEKFEYKHIYFTVWDVGGQDQVRPLWRDYFQGTKGLIFVVDSNDRKRISAAQKELQRVLQENGIRDDAVLLVYANKQDLPDAMNIVELTDKLGLRNLGNRRWYIQAICATEGHGVYEGLDWLADEIAKI